MATPDLSGFSIFLTIGISLLSLSLVGKPKPGQKPQADTIVPPSAHPTVTDADIAALQQQCLRLREELQQQKAELTADLQATTFEQLQTLLTNYPTARKMAQLRPDLPAKNLIALFTPLETLLQDWQIEPIGTPWATVPYDAQLHQPDQDDITEGEQVYIRFVGYRQHDRILYPARVSRTLPGG